MNEICYYIGRGWTFNKRTTEGFYCSFVYLFLLNIIILFPVTPTTCLPQVHSFYFLCLEEEKKILQLRGPPQWVYFL